MIPGLLLRVGKKGDKIWETVVSENGKRSRVRLGTYPALSVKQARLDAEAAKTAPTRSRHAEIRTVADLFERYRAARQDKRRAWRDVENAWTNWAAPQIGHIRLTDLTAYDALDLRDHVTAHIAARCRAGAVLRYIRPMFSWAADERIIPVNPWAGLRTGGKPQARDRVLTEPEWERLWWAAGELRAPFGPFVKALMLTGQRLSNVAQMEWSEIQGDVWVVPASKFKATKAESAHAHEVPLSPALAALIAEQPRTGPYVFSARGDKAITPGSKLKAELSELAGLTDWRFHDIRRTAATRMAENGASRFVVERVLGHADNSVTAIYDRASYRAEKRAALCLLSGDTAACSSIKLREA